MSATFIYRWCKHIDGAGTDQHIDGYIDGAGQVPKTKPKFQRTRMPTKGCRKRSVENRQAVIPQDQNTLKTDKQIKPEI